MSLMTYANADSHVARIQQLNPKMERNPNRRYSKKNNRQPASIYFNVTSQNLPSTPAIFQGVQDLAHLSPCM